MFSSFSLFNFYQQPNTGFQPPSLNTGILLSGNNESGKVADFNWYFPYASTNILVNAILSQSRFGYHIWADSYGAVVPGIHYATISTAMSGSFQANYNSIYLSNQLYGTVYPQFKEIASMYTMFSGLISGVPHDYILQHTTYSGLITGQKSDPVFISNTFSGQIASNSEPLYVNTMVSGIINQVPNDVFNGQHNISGHFWPTKTDLANLSFNLFGYGIASGITVVAVTGADHANLSLTLIGYQVNS